MFLKYFYSSAAIMSKCLIFQYGYSVTVCVVLLHSEFQLCFVSGSTSTTFIFALLEYSWKAQFWEVGVREIGH